jgi:AcrR family transcriptional regulator
MAQQAPYHHGDLRSALIRAGEDVLQSTGVDGFSLRRVARSVGVSHSAPAHHFGDSNGLLDAIAADGFTRLHTSMEQHNRQNGPDQRAALVGSGLGYIAFALSAPAIFGLMFGPHKLRSNSTALEAAAAAAFEHLAQNIEALRGADRTTDPTVMQDILASWSMVHGLSDLLIAGRMPDLQNAPQDIRDQTLRAIVSRALPIDWSVDWPA